MYLYPSGGQFNRSRNKTVDQSYILYVIRRNSSYIVDNRVDKRRTQYIVFRWARSHNVRFKTTFYARLKYSNSIFQ